MQYYLLEWNRISLFILVHIGIFKYIEVGWYMIKFMYAIIHVYQLFCLMYHKNSAKLYIGRYIIN